MSPLIAPAGKKFSLSGIDPADTNGREKESTKKEALDDLRRLDELCHLMYAEDRQALLVVLQGIDASGKNSTIRHIAREINPEGLTVYPFKEPTDLEIEHDYLWRVHNQAPRRGNVAIFNRSHYEEVIVTKVHRRILDNQHLPKRIANDPDIFEKRYRQINDFERMLAENGTIVVKFLLHISREEQIDRFRERVNNRKKQWKFSEGDLEKRKHWNRYMTAFEEMVRATSTSNAPWYVVPADRKWYRNWMIGRILVDTLERLDMKYPKLRNGSATIEDLERA